MGTTNDYRTDLRFAGIEPFETKVWLSSPTMHGEEQKYVDEAIRTDGGKNRTEVCGSLIFRNCRPSSGSETLRRKALRTAKSRTWHIGRKEGILFRYDL